MTSLGSANRLSEGSSARDGVVELGVTAFTAAGAGAVALTGTGGGLLLFGGAEVTTGKVKAGEVNAGKVIEGFGEI